MWTAVNERDELGDELVPDYLTSVRDGGFYGWPYAYFGTNEDPRLAGQRPDLVARSLPPDLSLGAHTASLGLTFYRGTSFPRHYRGGAFIGQHGSWNRAELSGYKVVFVPFSGRPAIGAARGFPHRVRREQLRGPRPAVRGCGAAGRLAARGRRCGRHDLARAGLGPDTLSRLPRP